MSDVQLLRDGLAKIEAGWTQGELNGIDERGIICYCALGAMGVTSFDDDDGNPELTKAVELLWPALPDDAKSDETNLCDIWRFNDKPSTDEDDVKVMFIRAIEMAEAKS